MEYGMDNEYGPCNQLAGGCLSDFIAVFYIFIMSVMLSGC